MNELTINKALVEQIKAEHAALENFTGIICNLSFNDIATAYWYRGLTGDERVQLGRKFGVSSRTGKPYRNPVYILRHCIAHLAQLISRA